MEDQFSQGRLHLACSGTHTATIEYFGVYDGHTGVAAAAFAKAELPVALAERIATAEVCAAMVATDGDVGASSSWLSTWMKPREETARLRLSANQFWPYHGPWHTNVTSHPAVYTASSMVRTAIHRAFWSVDRAFKHGHPEERSGTTATVALLVHPPGGRRAPVLVVAHVGDSRAVLCCERGKGSVVLTEDHTASHPVERARVQQRGGTVACTTPVGPPPLVHGSHVAAGGVPPTGFVQHRGVWRVQGELVITRTIGDIPLQHYLSAQADVVVVPLTDPSGATAFDFVVIASDGLWDVMANDEAVRFVQRYRQRHHPQHDMCDGALDSGDCPAAGASDSWEQHAATALAREAFVRGSSDNIGVLVVPLR